MSTTSDPDVSSNSCSECELTDRQRAAVLWEWCLRREALALLPQIMIVAPLLLIQVYGYYLWGAHWYPNKGRDCLSMLFATSLLAVLGGGATHAARAISWEVSSDLRELVRLTGIGPLTLLCCKSLARWVTIGCSVLVMAPIICFAMTLIGTTTTQLVAYGWGLLMLTMLVASMAALSGVISTAGSNTSSAAAMTMFVLMLLYHMIFWLTGLAILLANWLITRDWSFVDSSWLRDCADFIWQSTPVMVIVQIGTSWGSFNPLSPSYWMHFLAALCVFRYAAIIIVNRFRSAVRGNQGEIAEDGDSSVVTGRPRCGAAPFYWKDAYVLVGLRSQRNWNVVYFLLANAVAFSALLQWNTDFPVGLGILAECACPIMFAVRFDSMISAEFRQKTWHDLMLLPIDRATLLWAKARAICWQHRMAALPVGIAIAVAFPRAPTVIFMTGVIAILAGVLLSQVAAIYYLTPKYWWSGPSQMLACLFLIVFCLVIWINFPVWPGFFMVATLLSVATIPIQRFIEASLDGWTESPEYQTGNTSNPT